MKNTMYINRIMSVLLTVMIVLFGAAAVSTAPANAIDNRIGVRVSSDVYVLKKYLKKDADGKIVFDKISAIHSGASREAIEIVGSQIQLMNKMSDSNNSIVGEDYSVTTYYVSGRVRGVNKTVIHWYGLIEWYMDSGKAQLMIDMFGETAKNVMTVGEAYSVYSWIPTIFASGMLIAQAAIVNAAEPGRGIIMKQQNIPGSDMPALWFDSQ